MAQNSDASLNKFLLNFPKQEIIETLNEIDTKISSLHTISSKDFLFFNKILKDYYKQIKEIAEGNNTIVNYFSKDLPGITQKLSQKNQSQKAIIEEANQNINKLSEKLSQSHSAFDLLIVPTNNFKQNLITLKYILANIKLHLVYIDLKNKKELQEKVESLEVNIETINQKVEETATETETVFNEIVQIKKAAQKLKGKSSTQALENLKNVAQELGSLTIKDFWPDSIVTDLNKHTQACFANMGEVITNIQYHDIIRQKMEHIQSSQKELIQGLNKIEETGKSETETETENKIDFIVKIPEITDIQVAQLLYTNKDYQTSIEKITNMLIEVGNETKQLNKVYTIIENNTVSFEDSFLQKLLNCQESFIEHTSEIDNQFIDTNEQIEKLKNRYQKLKENYHAIFSLEKNLRTDIRGFEKLIKANGPSFGQELMRKFLSLLSDLQLNSNSLKNNLNNITKQFGDIHHLGSLQDKNAETNSEIKLETVNELKEKTEIIKDIALKYAELSNNISVEIAQSLKKIEYYTFFKKNVEEIVTLLNKINKKVNYDALKSLVGENEDILKKIEKLYTMKSEREVHSKYLKANGDITELFNSDDEEEIDDNDIELF